MQEHTKDESQKQEKSFVIMPISDQGDYPAGHFTKVYEQIIQPAVRGAGYEPYRVDENNICDNIINKIFDAIQECPMAICDLSNRNPNVLYELGLRQAYDKPVVLIQDEKTEKIFDVSGISTVFYKGTGLYDDVMEARENIKNAILSTKNGKMNTLVKIVNARTPDLSKIEISSDDKVQVMLDRIYNEIRQANRRDTAYEEIITLKKMNDVNYVLNSFLRSLYEIECRIDSTDNIDVLFNIKEFIKEFQNNVQINDVLPDQSKKRLLERALNLEKIIRYKIDVAN